MLKTLWNGRSGLNSNQNRLDAISNNIANVETSGYKRIDVAFEDIFSEKMNRLGLPITSENRDSLVLGSGSRGDKIVRTTEQGYLSETGKEEDLAIYGGGFFKVLDENRVEFFTRDGSFSLDSDGNFVHSSGMLLEVENFDKYASGKPFTVNSGGEIISDKGAVGKINLYDFVDKDNMIPAGKNLFTGTLNPQEAKGSINQGYIEKSNVDIGRELTDMMITQRAYELNSRSVKAADDMWQIANNLRGR